LVALDVISRSISITRRLVTTVLALESVATLALILAVIAHEHHVELQAFDATLTGTAQALMGSVQDAEDVGDNVVLDLRSVPLEKDAIYLVEDDHGKVLGSSGSREATAQLAGSAAGFRQIKLLHKVYRFTVFHGTRFIDPGTPNGGVGHNITIIYGLPVGKVWSEVFEAIRFFVIATVLFMGVTGVIMALMIRKYLAPVHQLAEEADRMTVLNWQFDAPESAKRTVELRPLARALEAAALRVQLSFEQQKRFTRDAAHELKTDVAIVKSSLQFLSMRKRTADEYSHGLSVSLEDFTRLESTVQRLLTLARLEQPVTVADATASFHCSMKKAVEEAVHQSSSFAQLKEIEIATELSDDAEVLLDKRDAVLLVSNILINALQHSPNKGRVLISLTRRPAGAVLICKDWGEGVSEEDRPFLFDAFYRGDASRSRKSGGTGLGLSICKAICVRVGGTIEIANHSEKGALVTVILPEYKGISDHR
jgi:signal transduction histidine kinase